MQQTREELIEQSENARKKELELGSDLVAARKSIAELEVSFFSGMSSLNDPSTSGCFGISVGQ